jgi:hypothetical protein
VVLQELCDPVVSRYRLNRHDEGMRIHYLPNSGENQFPGPDIGKRLFFRYCQKDYRKI